jgi:formylglycine-generating enzyme
MFCIQRLKYIALFLLLALIIFGCGKEPAEPVFDNPNDPLSPNYVKKGDNTNTGQSQLPSSITGNDGAPMVLIPAGEFQMGDSLDGMIDALPVHTVYLDAFYMDIYEVTNAQYKKFVQATGRKEPEGDIYLYNGMWPGKPWSEPNFNGDNQPVTCVSWYDAVAYTEWAGKRLPTEAEWEKAARGGLVGKKYVWGDEWPPPNKAGNFPDETVKKKYPTLPVITGYDDGYIYYAPVGSFTKNGYDLFDMVGNVWEWCADWYSINYYAISPRQNPTGPRSGVDYVFRGGSWDDVYSPESIRVASRRSTGAIVSSNLIGFRCAQDVFK